MAAVLYDRWVGQKTGGCDRWMMQVAAAARWAMASEVVAKKGAARCRVQEVVARQAAVWWVVAVVVARKGAARPSYDDPPRTSRRARQESSSFLHSV